MKILSKWKKTELIWLVAASTIITALSMYWGDTFVGIMSALTGIICVILTAKGNIWCYAWGLINSILYAYIGYINGYYGEFLLNALYYVPMQIFGYYMWKKHMDTETDTVEFRKLNKRDIVKVTVAILVGIMIWGEGLRRIGGELPYIDGTTNVLSFVAMILSIKRYAEQWILWIIINIISVGMWAYAMTNGSDNIATLLMWSVYLGNSIWGYIKWAKGSKEN